MRKKTEKLEKSKKTTKKSKTSKRGGKLFRGKLFSAPSRSHIVSRLKSSLKFIGKLLRHSGIGLLRWLGKWFGFMILTWIIGPGLILLVVGFLISNAIQGYKQQQECLDCETPIIASDHCPAYEAAVLKMDTRRVDAVLYRRDVFAIPNFFDSDRHAKNNWIALKAQLEQASSDPKIKGILIEYRGFSSGSMGVQQLYLLLQDFKKRTDKKVWIFATQYGLYHGLSDHRLASLADEVLLAPSGYVEFAPLISEQHYFKRLFDRFKIEPNFTRRHEYKSAPSSFTTTKPSEAEIENTQLLLKDLEANDTKILKAHLKNFDTLLQGEIFSAADAWGLGAVDKLIYANNVENYLQEQLGKGEGEDTEILDLECYEYQPKSKETHAKIQVINLVGVIQPEISYQDIAQNRLLQDIEDAKENEQIDGILVYIDSPGGDYAMSERLWHALYSSDKPVIALMGNVAASGGYFVAAAADKIFAYDNSVTASIGVFSGEFVLRKFFTDILLIDPYLLSADGRDVKAAPYDRRDSVKARYYERFIDQIYDDFTKKINLKRKFSPEQLDNVARGRVFSGARARTLGLIDGTNGLTDVEQWFEAELKQPIRYIPHIEEYNFQDWVFLNAIYLWGDRVNAYLQHRLYRLGLTGGVRTQFFADPQ